MAVKIVPSLRSTLERLKHAGAINGICLAWRRQVLINMLPFEDFRAEKLIRAVHEAHEHFVTGGREVKTFWFGFEGVYVLAQRRNDCTLIVLHSQAVEADFIAHASEVLLEDCQLIVQAALDRSGSNVGAEETQKLGGEAVP